jgi:hypothetical protein
MQGYNAQAAVTAGQIVIAAEISVNSPDFGLLRPVCDAALSELAAVDVSDTPGVLVADAGYCNRSSSTASRSSSRPTPATARAPHPAGTEASTRSCAASCRHVSAARRNANAKA